MYTRSELRYQSPYTVFVSKAIAVADAPNTNTVILMTHTISLSDAWEESMQSQLYKQCAGSLRDEQDKWQRFNTDLIQSLMSKADVTHGN